VDNIGFVGKVMGRAAGPRKSHGTLKQSEQGVHDDPELLLVELEVKQGQEVAEHADTFHARFHHAR
jgi:hypothetical protein